MTLILVRGSQYSTGSCSAQQKVEMKGAVWRLWQTWQVFRNLSGWFFQNLDLVQLGLSRVELVAPTALAAPPQPCYTRAWWAGPGW